MSQKTTRNVSIDDVITDPLVCPSLQLVHVLNMTSAEIFTYTVQPDDDVASLQERIAQDTRILPDNQELLLEAGLALEPHNNIMQCAIDYSVGLNMKCFKRFCRGCE